MRGTRVANGGAPRIVREGHIDEEPRPKGSSPAQHLVGDHAEREHVGSLIG